MDGKSVTVAMCLGTLHVWDMFCLVRLLLLALAVQIAVARSFHRPNKDDETIGQLVRKQAAGKPIRTIVHSQEKYLSIVSAILSLTQALEDNQQQLDDLLEAQRDLQDKLERVEAQIIEGTDIGAILMLDPRNIYNSYRYVSDEERRDMKTKLLFEAFERGQPHLAEFWIKNGARPHWPASSKTAIQLAVSREWISVVQLLLNHGVDIRARSHDDLGETLLQQAVREGASASFVRLLVPYSDVDAVDKLHGQTALHLAVQSDRLDLADILVNFGKADLEVEDMLGYRPMHAAVRNLDIVTMLVNNGADVEARTLNERTPLHLAVIENALPVARFLLSLGVDVICVDGYDQSPADYAATMHRNGLGDADRSEMQILLAPYVYIRLHQNLIPTI